MRHLKYTPLIFFISILFAWSYPVVDNRNAEFIDIAIKKFLRSSRLVKKGNVFSILIKHFDGNIIGVSIYGSTAKPFITKKASHFNYTGLPSHYLEANGKLFYWDENNEAGTSEIARVLEKYHFIDTATLDIPIPEHFVDEKKKGEHYYFCIENKERFKKIITTKAMGSYPVPKLDCRK